MKSVPDEDSSLSNLLTSQSKLLENWVQLFLFPRINAAVGDKERLQSVHVHVMHIHKTSKTERRNDKDGEGRKTHAQPQHTPACPSVGPSTEDSRRRKE